MEVLIVIAGLFLAVAISAAVRMRTARRLEAADEMSDSKACWICSSTELEQLDRFTYRCTRCSAVQGSNAQAYRDAAQRADLAALSKADRRRLASETLAEAHLERDLYGSSSDGGREKLHRFSEALLEVAKVERKLEQAAAALEVPIQLQHLSVELGTARVVLDQLDIRVDGIKSMLSGGAEARTHEAIERSLLHMSELERHHDALKIVASTP